MDKRPTIIDVATRAGVSKSTVSLVLQQSPLVRRETRSEDVRRAMADLGYVYNRAAANLRSANAGLIGLVINDLRNPFFTEFATSLRWRCRRAAMPPSLPTPTKTPRSRPEVVGAMLEHGVSALIVSPAYGDEAATFDAIARANVPALPGSCRQVVDTARFPFAAPDYPTGSRLATEHLLAKGARHIAFVGGLEGRARGHATAHVGLSRYPRHPQPDAPPPAGRPGRAFGREAARRLAQEHPAIDAVICFNDLTALGLLTGCARQHGVGASLKIVGFDDIEGLRAGLSRLVFRPLRHRRFRAPDGGNRAEMAGRGNCAAARDGYTRHADPRASSQS